MVAALALIPLAYLLGTFPSAEIIGRIRGVDVRRAGSGNPGASNVARLFGWKLGLVVFLFDMGKGALASGVGLVLDGNRGAYVLGVAAVVGHVLPAWRRFRGGRGVATSAGALLVLFPLIALGIAALWLVIARGLRKASIASLVCAILSPTLVAVTGHSTADIAVTSAISVIVGLRHLSNLQRLITGREHGLRRARGKVSGDGGSASTHLTDV